MSGPSEKAIEAALSVESKPGGAYNAAAVDVIAQAMHDPALGLARSVCLRDVFSPLEELMVWADRYDGEIAGRVRDWMREFADVHPPR